MLGKQNFQIHVYLKYKKGACITGPLQKLIRVNGVLIEKSTVNITQDLKEGKHSKNLNSPLTNKFDR